MHLVCGVRSEPATPEEAETRMDKAKKLGKYGNQVETLVSRHKKGKEMYRRVLNLGPGTCKFIRTCVLMHPVLQILKLCLSIRGRTSLAII